MASVTWFDRFAVLLDLFYILKAAIPPTISATFRQPSLLVHPRRLQDVFFQNVWAFMGDGVDAAGAETKHALLPAACGVVLEIGAGHGHSCKYLDTTRVTRYIALEPSIEMHKHIPANAVKAGFEPAQIQMISCSAEETEKILEALGGEQVDTLVSILGLCGIPDVKKSVAVLTDKVLKLGGVFLFYEHVRCDSSPTLAWWQAVWTPICEPILGCRLDKPTHHIIDALDIWEDRKLEGKVPEEPPNLFWHRYRKKL
ncbi:SubName: Full=Uncharacterized protein {ECO:0000313/EMBL:CCA75222.1} [Serendipita indica DSM 11827]|nr:SubName: Full=Uncharacterized protein {ECO:0000313/EMBL:CCA75222.1} [Serendipita indica DSM 11827]